jgi:tetratricopeptide (TPR) repeat protein
MAFTSVMRIFTTILIGTALTLSAPAAFASSFEQARAAHAQGDFPAAAALAAPIGSAKSHILAAEALGAQVLLGTAQSPKKTARKALAHAEAALMLEPDNHEAQLQRALADGFITRAANPLTAGRKKLPQRTKAVVDEFLARNPDDPRAHALLGAWHIGVIRKAGAKRGGKWFGAQVETGLAAYETALVLKPDDIIIGSNFALSLIDLDYAANQRRAKAILLAATARETSDPIEQAVQRRVQEVLKIWDTPKAAQKSAGRFLDGGG